MPEQVMEINDTTTSALERLIQQATERSMSNLSQMLGTAIATERFSVHKAALTEISQLVGGPEVVSVGIYLSVSGDAEGHIMLIYEPAVAYAFVDLMMMQPPNTTTALGDMESSALGELGNVIGASFLNVIADAAGVGLKPSPPAVLMDMAGSLMDIVVSDMLPHQTHTLIAETVFRAPDREISGSFFVMASDQLLGALSGWSQAT